MTIEDYAYQWAFLAEHLNKQVNNMLSQSRLKDAERVTRLVMSVILLTAGTSKFFSGGGFADYYAGQFAGELRIVLPAVLVKLYLMAIPFIEVGLGAALLVTRLKPATVYAWFAFMLSLLVGHYVLQEWSAVNQMLDYFFWGCCAWFCHTTKIGFDETFNSHADVSVKLVSGTLH